MSSVSVAEAGRQLSQLINRAAYGREVVVITSRGQAKAVLLGVEAFDQLVGLDELSSQPIPPLSEFRQRTRAAFAESGYSSREDILALTQAVRQERFAERAGELLPVVATIEDTK